MRVKWEMQAGIRLKKKSASSNSKANHLEAQCQAKGLNLTRQRRLIVRVLSESTDHPDAPELHRRVHALDPHVSLATVYRSVRILEQRGILNRHEFRRGRARFEIAASAHHDHLIDIESGTIVEFREPQIEQLQARVAGRLGYRLVGHRLELYGSPLQARRRSQRR
jgi:Fur family transcriptional regulator, ferric uptake regulator